MGRVKSSASQAEYEKGAPLCECGCRERTTWLTNRCRWRKYVTGHYRRQAPYKDRSWLAWRYFMDNLTAAEIAAECGVHPTTIYKQMRKLGIEARDRSASRMGRHLGAANGSWRGGTTPERQRFYRKPAWAAMCAAIFKRDDYRCQRCHQRRERGCQVTLHVHHVKPWASHPELRAEPSNLTTLCGDCHMWVHSLQNVESEFIAA